VAWRLLKAIEQPLGLRVVAESVETPEQCAFLLQRGCNVQQGYLVFQTGASAGAGTTAPGWPDQLSR
jgi:EAL domain-containing protein (putative c-di-GMP-specific phosphodiesterase class I)